MPHIEYPLATRAGVLGAAVLALLGIMEYSGFESAYQRQYRDANRIAAQSVRFEGFREEVAANAILGYLTKVAPDVSADAMFLAAQYSLAPRLLVRKTVGENVLGNFIDPEDAAAIGRQYGLRIEREFGDGVVLYRRETK